MDSPNIFTLAVSKELIARIEQLSPNNIAKWGKMSVSQMVAHCSVTYEMIYTNKHPKPNAALRFLLKTFVKKKVVGTSSYKKNSPTAPAFVIQDKKELEEEKKRLIAYIEKTQELGEDHFDGKESHSFGKLNKSEWNNMLYKHLDYHLAQFGV